ncbi:unnamed protein product [Heterobilharzia americana]|nr:unnamed protein product [Heterobilharzia americana]
MSVMNNKIKEDREEIDSIKSIIDGIKKVVEGFQPLAYLFGKDKNLVPSHIEKVETLIDYLATEVMKGLVSSQQATVYGVPSTISLNVAKKRVLNSCGMTPMHCDCKHLRKKAAHLDGPILFKFTTSYDAKRFINYQDHI